MRKAARRNGVRRFSGAFGPGGTRRLAQGKRKDKMGQKKIGGWQGLAKFVAAHMHEDVGDDRLDRAVETAAGHLARNPRHVVASLALERLTLRVLAGVISPNGKIALVVAFDDAQCGLVTWSREQGLREDAQGESWFFDQSLALEISFPHGSEEPAVVGFVRDECACPVARVVWDDWVLDLPHTRHSLKDACLTMWQEGSVFNVASIRNGGIVHLSSRDRGTPGIDATIDTVSREGTEWIGLVDGSLARITREDSFDVMRWRDLKAAVPSASIFSGSVAASAGWLQFVVDSGRAGKTVYYSDGRELKSSTVPANDVIFGDGQIFLVHRGPSRGLIMRLNSDRFVHCAEQGMALVGGPMPEIGKNARIFDFGETVVVSDFSGPVHESVKRVWTITGKATSCGNNSTKDINIERFHHGIAIYRKADNGDEYVHWEAPSALKIGRWANFPLYNTPFDRLTPVEDARGEAIMSWSFVGGTLHVIRYDLPNE